MGLAARTKSGEQVSNDILIFTNTRVYVCRFNNDCQAYSRLCCILKEKSQKKRIHYHSSLSKKKNSCNQKEEEKKQLKKPPSSRYCQSASSNLIYCVGTI